MSSTRSFMTVVFLITLIHHCWYWTAAELMLNQDLDDLFFRRQLSVMFFTSSVLSDICGLALRPLSLSLPVCHQGGVQEVWCTVMVMMTWTELKVAKTRCLEMKTAERASRSVFEFKISENVCLAVVNKTISMFRFCGCFRLNPLMLMLKLTEKAARCVWCWKWCLLTNSCWETSLDFEGNWKNCTNAFFVFIFMMTV